MSLVVLAALLAFFRHSLIASVTTEEMKEILPREYKILGPTVFESLVQLLQDSSRISEPPQLCNGRLTLTSGTAVTTSNVIAASTIYFTPYNGKYIALYNGTRWGLMTFTEQSVAVPSNTTTPFDIFGYANSGSLTLETLAWTNDTTRATALATQDGVYVKSGDATHRYLGTGRTTSSSGQTEDSESSRFLWNECNRVPRKVLAQSNTDTWNYTTATWRAANNTTTTGVTRIEYVIGRQVENIELEVYVPSVGNTTVTPVGVGIGINSTSTNSADFFGASAGIASNGYQGIALAEYHTIPSVGYSYAQWLEASVATGTTSWYTYDTTKFRQAALTGEIWQ